MPETILSETIHSQNTFIRQYLTPLLLAIAAIEILTMNHFIYDNSVDGTIVLTSQFVGSMIIPYILMRLFKAGTNGNSIAIGLAIVVLASSNYDRLVASIELKQVAHTLQQAESELSAREQVSSMKGNPIANLLSALMEARTELTAKQTDIFLDINSPTLDEFSVYLMQGNPNYYKKAYKEVLQVEQKRTSIENRIIETYSVFTAKLESHLNSGSYNEEIRQKYWSQLKRAIKRSQQATLSSIKQYYQYMAIISDICIFMDLHEGSYELRDDQLLFATDEQAAQFNEMIERYNNTLQSLVSIEQQRQEQNNRFMTRLGEQLNQ